jgi:hypothetical protein
MKCATHVTRRLIQEEERDDATAVAAQANEDLPEDDPTSRKRVLARVHRII